MKSRSRTASWKAVDRCGCRRSPLAWLVKYFTRPEIRTLVSEKQPKIPDSVVRRLSLYLRALRELRRSGKGVISSRELARFCGTTSAQIRKDLSCFGSFGKRGQGYLVAELVVALEEILALDRRWKLALVGVGKIGSALLGYRDLPQRGFDVVAAFDTAPSKIGRRVAGVRISPLEDLEKVVREAAVEMAVIATPPDVAQDVAGRLRKAGVTGILNFAPVKLSMPPDVAVRTVDVVLELEGLCYLVAAEQRPDRLGVLP